MSMGAHGRDGRDHHRAPASLPISLVERASPLCSIVLDFGREIACFKASSFAAGDALNDAPHVVFSAYGEIEDVAVPPGGAVFFLDPDAFQALFGVEYAEEVVRTWKREGTFEPVTDDLARAIEAGRASLHGSGTADDPYYVEVERGGT